MSSFNPAIDTCNSDDEFTGGIKFYPVGVSFGGSSPAIGFSTVVFGNIGANEKISLQLSSNTAGNLILTDLIMFAVRITPASVGGAFSSNWY